MEPKEWLKQKEYGISAYALKQLIHQAKKEEMEMIKNIIFDIGGIILEWGNNPNLAKALRQEVIDCAIALKQVVRTYNLV